MGSEGKRERKDRDREGNEGEEEEKEGQMDQALAHLPSYRAEGRVCRSKGATGIENPSGRGQTDI